MLVRLVIMAALFAPGLCAADAGVTSGSAPAISTATAVAARTVADVAKPDDVSLTQRNVVVPAVDPAGDVVVSPKVLSAQRDDNAIVADRVVQSDRVESAVVLTATFQTVGVTWPEGANVDNLAAKVRTRSDDQWSDWVGLEASDGGPDTGSVDAASGARGGSESVWVGSSDAVQLSFAAHGNGGPDGLNLVLIGSPQPAAPSSGAPAAAAASRADVSGATFSNASYRTTTLRAAVSAPTVISRGEWGARAPVCTPDVASTLVGAVVHHTAGSNSYATVAEAMQQIRNDQSYHIDARGWCDIGYNFIVDKWGNIYEGRANSLTQAVIGVHAGGFNTGTVGVAMLGSYDAAPPAATQEAVARIIGWRLGAYGVDPRGSMNYYTSSGENSRFTNENVALPRVFGHRDVAYTACPGNGGYAALGAIRELAAVYAPAQSYAQAQAVVASLYRDILGRAVDPGGLQTWSLALMEGMTPAQLGDYLVTSPEYAFATVARDYQSVLGRAPDPYGLHDWTDAIISGSVRSEDLRLWLFSSVEFYNQSGKTDVGYVGALYRHVLGRDAGPSELATWVPVAAQYGSAAILGGVWGSWESAVVRVNQFYQRYLGRAADPAGLTTWPPVLLSYGEDQLRGHILGSLEYFNRAQQSAV